MKRILPILLTISWMLPGVAFSQPEGRAQPPQRSERPQVDREQARDMSRARDSALREDGNPDRTRIRDRIHTPEDMHGHQLLTAEERARFRSQLRAADTLQERRLIVNRHRDMVLERAEARGTDVDGGPLFGRTLMTAEERRRMREEMMDATSDAERERIREEHRQKMLERARERGIDID